MHDKERAMFAEMVGVEVEQLLLIQSRRTSGCAVFSTAYDEYWTARRVSTDWQTGPAEEPTAKWGEKPHSDGRTVYRDAASGPAVAYRWVVQRLTEETLEKKRRQLEDICRENRLRLVQILSKSGLI